MLVQITLLFLETVGQRLIVGVEEREQIRPGLGETDVAGRAAAALPLIADDADARLTLASALARLSARQRAVLVSRFYEDRTEVDTARVLGCSVSTVKSTTRDALARLRSLAPELAATFGREEVPR